MTKVMISAVSLFTILLASCLKDEVRSSYGLNMEHASYIPARISIIPCLTWPANKYPNLPSSNVSVDQSNQICENFNKFVVDGFKGQPYMKGLSPTLVKQLLLKSKDAKAIEEIPDIWKKGTPKDACRDCFSPVDYYKSVIELNPYWRAWLNQFSRQVRNSDAILVPIVFYTREVQEKDRGLLVSKRTAGAVLLLIGNSKAELLWSGGREATVSEASLPLNSTPFPDYPDWRALYDRVFQKDIWREFPGRQIF